MAEPRKAGTQEMSIFWNTCMEKNAWFAPYFDDLKFKIGVTLF